MAHKQCDVCKGRRPRHTKWDGPARRVKRVTGQPPAKCDGAATRQCRKCAAVFVYKV